MIKEKNIRNNTIIFFHIKHDAKGSIIELDRH